MSLPSSVELRQGFERLLRQPEPSDDYMLGGSLGAGYWGRSRPGRPVALFPLKQAVSTAATQFEGLRFAPLAPQNFSWQGTEKTCPAALLACLDASLLDVFASLVRDVALRISPEEGEDTISWATIRDAVAHWQRLFARARTMPQERELGLWGELAIMLATPDVNTAAECWFGFVSNPVDFVGGGIGVECKTSKSGHVHWVSQAQVDNPEGDYPVFVASLWAAEDPIRGTTLVEQIAAVATQLADDRGFWEKLLRYGYSPRDSGAYRTRFALREPPCWFAGETVPRVRVADDGVSSLRYRADLRVGESIDDSGEIVARLVGMETTV